MKKQQLRSAYQHRVWRLALLLTADRRRAIELFTRVLLRRPDFHRLDPDHLTRLVILHARELAGRRPAVWERLFSRRPHDAEGEEPGDASAGRTLRALRDLPRQSMEAWLLRHVDGLGDIALSRAMDCSRTAVMNHLRIAEEELSETLGEDAERAATTLREAVRELDPAPAIAVWRVRRSRRRLLRLLLFLLVLLIIAWIAWWIAQSEIVRRLTETLN